jgi:hypothetical protein
MRRQKQRYFEFGRRFVALLFWGGMGMGMGGHASRCGPKHKHGPCQVHRPPEGHGDRQDGMKDVVKFLLSLLDPFGLFGKDDKDGKHRRTDHK